MSTNNNHGLTATNPALPRSERIRFNRFRTAQLECLDPRGPTETYLAERIVFHRWLLLKCDQAEAAALRDAVWTDEPPPSRIPEQALPELRHIVRTVQQAARPPDGQPIADHRTVSPPGWKPGAPRCLAPRR